MIGNQGKNYSNRVSKMRFFDEFSRMFQFQTLGLFSWDRLITGVIDYKLDEN